MNIPMKFLFTGAIAVPLLQACGGSSGSSTVDIGPNNGDLCENSYYTQLRGEYTGTAFYSDRDRQCEWELSITVAPSSRLLGCELNASIKSSVTQLIVYDRDDENVYQCTDTDGVYDLNEPNSNLLPTSLYESVEFPVDVQILDNPIGLTSGPYFGDTSIEVPYVNLLDEGGLIQFLSFGSDDTVNLRGGNPPFFTFEGTLSKEQQ
ncbi:hypothetical protein [Maritalea sp.]|uniref:hypothetical protein n=1 Tax=Maritalea sp. TaxID=2003361 RepID=UPI003EF15225